MAEYVDTTETRERLVADLRQVISDAEELLSATSGNADVRLTSIRERVAENLKQARFKLADAEEAIRVKTKEVARATDDYVHEHPWKAVGAAAGVGLIVGLLIGRR